MSNQLEMVSGLSRYSTLAEASYGDFKPALQDDGSYKQSDVEDAIKDTGNKNNFSATQAADFVTHWRVVDHQPETTSGFSATLFQRIDNDPESGLKAGNEA